MSLNKLQLTSPSSFDLLPGESVLTPRHPADIELRIPATMYGPKRTETAKGFLWVTDHRVVFAADLLGEGSSSAPPSYDAPPRLQSIVIPYSTLLSCTFNLPTFSANNLLLSFLPDPAFGSDSGLPSPGRGASLELKVVIGDGAGHGVWKRIEGERQSAKARRDEGEMLRVVAAYTANDDRPPAI